MKKSTTQLIDEIINEAATGRVDCALLYFTNFETEEEGKIIHSNIDIKDKSMLITPRLRIRNRKTFDEVMELYLQKAYDFYDESYYDIDEKMDKQDTYRKAIMTLIWSNATSEDFSSPELFIRKYYDFLTDKSFEIGKETELGNTESLGNISYSIEKEPLFEETPYSMRFKINGEELPTVRYGIREGKGYIYAIQNTKKQKLSNKLNRKLYKTEEGIDLKSESKDNVEHPENLSGVTPSTLVSATLALGLLSSKGIDEVIVPALFPVRWDAKEILFQRRAESLLKKGNTEDEIIDYLEQKRLEHLELQRNLSDKHIRTFRRLEHHFDNFEITAYPFVQDVDMHININSGELNCNNPMLRELYEISSKKNDATISNKL